MTDRKTYTCKDGSKYTAPSTPLTPDITRDTSDGAVFADRLIAIGNTCRFCDYVFTGTETVYFHYRSGANCFCYICKDCAVRPPEHFQVDTTELTDTQENTDDQ